MSRVVVLVYLFAFTNQFNCSAQSNEWELRKDKNGIKVYVRSNDESSFDEFKANTTLQNVSLQEAFELIMNIKNYETWFPDCSNPRILEQIDKYHHLHYIETLSPWPVDDRCGVYEQSAVFRNGDKTAEIVFKAKPDYPIDAEDMVRISDARGKWTLEEKNNILSVTYEFKGDPGGDIPAWLANSFVVKHPFETLTNFRIVLNQN
jgi:hypothetical protein